MANYFDRSGNVYRVEDASKLRKKNYVEVFNEAGEEFHLAAEVADEFKLTPDEKAKVYTDLHERIRELIKVAGGGGCEVIDPPDMRSVWGTRINPQIVANLARLMGGCPNIDPPDMGSVWGTRVNPQVIANLARLMGGCPNIDPADMGSIWGTRVNPQQELMAGLMRAMGGCPNIDPPDRGSIWGTRVNPQVNLIAGLLRAMGGCPNVDPMQVGSLIGTLGMLGGWNR